MGEKKIILLVITLISFFFFFQCSQKDREHLNLLDPKYENGDSNNDNNTTSSYHTGVVHLDKSSYMGTNNKAVITLIDKDLTSSTVTVKVKSTSDNTGINVTLTKGASSYTGRLGFSLFSSISGENIKVSPGDTITVSYNDKNPSSVRSTSAKWYLDLTGTNYYWLYSDVYTQDFKYDQSNPPVDDGGKLGVWGFCSISDDTTDYPSEGGSKSLKINYYGIGVIGGGCFWLYCDKDWHSTTEDLSEFENGYLSFWVKSTVSIEIKIETPSSSVSTYLSNYVTLSSNWQKVEIPLSDFSALDWTQIKTVIGFHYNGTATVKVDEIHFRKK